MKTTPSSAEALLLLTLCAFALAQVWGISRKNNERIPEQPVRYVLLESPPTQPKGANLLSF
jgi:hypothetical protein